MKIKFFIALLLIGFLAFSEEEGIISSTQLDQRGVMVTIYNVNLGLIKDQREIELPRGRGRLKFMDVASLIIPTSVHIKSLEDPDSLAILEQNYEYDLLSPSKLLDKYVGCEVRLYQKNPYTEREEMTTATLLSNQGGMPIFKIGDAITFNHPGRIIFPKVPENLISKPTLIWLFENSLSTTQKIEVSYLTNGINWQSDYVVTLNDKDDKADLKSWVTIDNKSGATYKDAHLKLVAGDVHRIKERGYEIKMGRLAKAMVEEKQFKEEAFFEYHIYTLQRKATIKDNQTKQISLVDAFNIPVKKEFLFQGAENYYYSLCREPMSNQKIGVFIEIENKKENNLGISLPQGTVRVYKEDREENLQFIGEDSIDHTPKDEKIRIKLGDAFDIVGTRKQMDWKKIAYDTYEASFEISIRNHKEEDVVVRVIEPIPGEWEMLSSSLKYTKTEAHTAEFNLPVPKDKEVKLIYRVRMRF
ncbi:MAG: DUF4139 domain-containing protein [bacterium]